MENDTSMKQCWNLSNSLVQPACLLFIKQNHVRWIVLALCMPKSLIQIIFSYQICTWYCPWSKIAILCAKILADQQHLITVAQLFTKTCLALGHPAGHTVASLSYHKCALNAQHCRHENMVCESEKKKLKGTLKWIFWNLIRGCIVQFNSRNILFKQDFQALVCGKTWNCLHCISHWHFSHQMFPLWLILTFCLFTHKLCRAKMLAICSV